MANKNLLICAKCYVNVQEYISSKYNYYSSAETTPVNADIPVTVTLHMYRQITLSLSL